MRFGCCGNLAVPGQIGLEIIEPAARFGFDYVELPLARLTALSEEEFQEVKKRVAASGIRCESCNDCFPAELRLTGPQADMGQIEAYLRKAFARAEELGVQIVVFGSGGAKTAPEGFPLDQAFEQVVAVGKLMAPLAKEHGIVIAIEPLRKPECNLINSFREGVELARRIDHENMKVLMDMYHMTWEKESPDIMREYGKEFLRHIHFANPKLGAKDERTYPAALDEWDYQPFIDAVKACGYDGRISLEAYCSDFEEQAPKALQFLRENF
jgi:D-psicose/D-tagatose/L-ribulose 3-epimerase